MEILAKTSQTFSFLVLFLFLIACTDIHQIPNLESLAGTWKIEKIEPADEHILESLIEARITFSEDGKLESYSLYEDVDGIETNKETAKYWTENDKIYIENNGISIGSFKFEGDYLLLTDPDAGLTVYFVRVKQ